MDAVSGLLDGPRARGAFVLRCVLAPPWSLRVRDEAPLALMAMVRGDAHLLRDGTDPLRLETGDLAIVRGPEPYVVADEVATPPEVVIHPGQRCTTPDGRPLADEMRLGVRTWGNDPHGGTVILVGAYGSTGEVGGRLVSGLPPVVVLRQADWDARLVPLLREEAERDVPGQDAVLDRLLDLLLISALRSWLARPEAGAPAWYRAQGDPVVGTALRLLHNNPAHPWTLAGLAVQTHVSRAALARRFKALVGEAPMAYLTGWRLSLAADMVREPGLTLGQVAQRVGYRSAFALSTAFKRVHGVSPQAYRAGTGDP